MYSEMRKTINSQKSSWKGRKMKTFMRSPMGRVSKSDSLTYLLSPVSLRSFFARLARMIGAYVSGTVKTIRM